MRGETMITYDEALTTARYYRSDITQVLEYENAYVFTDLLADVLVYPDTFVKVVDLDDICRMQQVHDGCFKTFDEVPKQALTLTVSMLMKAKYHFCMVPAPTKAKAAKRMLTGEISEECPCTILRTQPGSILYLDADSSSLL